MDDLKIILWPIFSYLHLQLGILLCSYRPPNCLDEAFFAIVIIHAIRIYLVPLNIKSDKGGVLIFYM